MQQIIFCCILHLWAAITKFLQGILVMIKVFLLFWTNYYLFIPIFMDIFISKHSFFNFEHKNPRTNRSYIHFCAKMSSLHFVFVSEFEYTFIFNCIKIYFFIKTGGFRCVLSCAHCWCDVGWQYQLIGSVVSPLKCTTVSLRILYNNCKGVPWVNAAAGILARSKLPYHSLVQDGEVNVTRIRGKHNLLHSIDIGFS